MATGPSAPNTWALIREDVQTHRRRSHPGRHALVLYRIGNAMHRGDGLRHRLGRHLYRMGRLLTEGLYGIELPPETTVGRRLHLPHPHGIVINRRAVIGDDCMIRHNVTIGAASERRRDEVPVIGDRVQIGSGAVIMGAVTIGDDVLIGPTAVVVDDVPAGHSVLAPTATSRPRRQTAARTTSRHARDRDKEDA